MVNALIIIFRITDDTFINKENEIQKSQLPTFPQRARV